MPSYNSQVTAGSPMQALYPGDTLTLFNAENPLVNQSSVAIALAVKDANNQQSLSLELIFSGAPGVFEFDAQDADTETEDAYLLIPVAGQITIATTGLNGRATARIELAPIKGRFFRLKCITPITNGGVTLTAKVTG